MKDDDTPKVIAEPSGSSTNATDTPKSHTTTTPNNSNSSNSNNHHHPTASNNSNNNKSVNNPTPHRLPEGENAAPLEVIGTTSSDKLVIIMVGLPATGAFA
jgi:hypothetical protein